MNFAEAERRFAELRQQYQQGRLTAAQFDEQLRAMMVQDPQGRWWAKERETGAWHYYEAASQSWVRGEPPVAPPPLPPAPPPAAPVQPTRPAPASGSVPFGGSTATSGNVASGANPNPAYGSGAAAQGGQAGGYGTTGGAGGGIPQRQNPFAPSSGQQGGGAGPTGGGQAPAVGEPQRTPPLQRAPLGAQPLTSQRPADDPFAPQPQPQVLNTGGAYAAQAEISPGMKILFYILSVLIPIIGVVFFFVYRNKPFEEDRNVARMCLILGLISIALSCLCSVASVMWAGAIFQSAGLV